MRAQAILEEQAELLGKLRGNTTFRDAVAGTLRLGRNKDVAYELVAAMSNHVQYAYPYYVTKDMSLLVQHAADGLDDEDLWDASLAPTSSGFVRFERPIEMQDVRGTTMLAHWMTWGPVEAQHNTPGTLVTVWNDTRDPDEVVKGLIEQFGRNLFHQVTGHWSIIGGTAMAYGIKLGPALIPVPEQYADTLESQGVTPTPFTSVERIVHALWLMLGQTIVNTREEEVPSKRRHKAKQMNLPSRVTIIDLRRMESNHPVTGQSHIEWNHRWITRGHWRWQAYGPGRLERKRIWIHDFIKGPEDKPLVVTDKIYALRR